MGLSLAHSTSLAQAELVEARSQGLTLRQAQREKKEQIAMLSDLVRIMAADGKLSEVEKRLFALAAAKMGIEKLELDDLIDKLVGKISK